MKKYFAGIIAALFAITLVSFTEVRSSDVIEEEFYWFEFSENGVGDQLGSGLMTRTEAITQSCPDVPGVDCARAYASTVDPEGPLNPHLDVIQKSQP